ncbi:MAG: MATE family efflux transporter [Clostridiales bacterium]|nr:MATE family efflux transporter [Clostridiales bacterium]
MSQAKSEKFIRMTETPIPKLVSTMAVPTIISMLVTSFYNMADTFFVGKIGTSASAAVGVVYSLMAVIQACGFFFGHGSGNFISRALGSNDMDDAEKMASTGFFSALIAGAIIGLTGLIFLDPLARLLGSTETILPYAKDYMKYILIGAPWMMSSLVLNNQLRFQGSAFYSMIGIASGAVINIALDPILIFVLDMGISGAALATIISQFISFCLLLRGTQQGENLRIRPKNFAPRWFFYKSILKGGLPSLFRQGLGSVGTICLNRSAGLYGDAAVAAMSICTRVVMFANSCVIGFGQGFQPVCGFNYGAKKYSRVREAFWFCVRTATVFLICAAVIGFTFAPAIIQFFRKGDPAVVEIGKTALRFQCLTFPLLGWITLCNMMMQTMGKAVRASFMAMARQGIFFIPTVLIMPVLFGLTGLQCSQPISDIITFAASIPLQISILKEMKADEKALSETES